VRGNINEICEKEKKRKREEEETGNEKQREEHEENEEEEEEEEKEEEYCGLRGRGPEDPQVDGSDIGSVSLNVDPLIQHRLRCEIYHQTSTE